MVAVSLSDLEVHSSALGVVILNKVKDLLLGDVGCCANNP
jgi:hypothetical protein